MMISFEK